METPRLLVLALAHARNWVKFRLNQGVIAHLNLFDPTYEHLLRDILCFFRWQNDYKRRTRRGRLCRRLHVESAKRRRVLNRHQ